MHENLMCIAITFGRQEWGTFVNQLSGDGAIENQQTRAHMHIPISKNNRISRS